MSAIDEILDPIEIPRMVRVKQYFDRPVIEHIDDELARQLEQKNVLKKISKGMSIAITVGSRGIANQPAVVKKLVEILKENGAEPFITPCMGSHGGASGAGQKEMLEGMGVTEEYTGAPIRSSMEVVQLGTTDVGLPVLIDRNSWEADGIIVLNRIKAHTSFEAPIESGLLKMIAIGLGKQKGAESCHDLGFPSMYENILDITRILIPQANILFGIGLIENSFHETCRIEVLGKEEFEEKEPALLEEAKRLQAKLFFESLDILIVDEVGKNISGTGMDTNVIGRYHTGLGSGGPSITRIVVLDLTEESHGNATGIGIADFTTRRLFDKMKFDQSYPNSLTSTVPVSANIPPVLKSDRQAIQAAIRTCNKLDKKNIRIVRIKNTLSLEEIEVSEIMMDELRNDKRFTIEGNPYPFSFDDNGNLR